MPIWLLALGHAGGAGSGSDAGGACPQLKYPGQLSLAVVQQQRIAVVLVPVLIPTPIPISITLKHHMPKAKRAHLDAQPVPSAPEKCLL